MINKLANVPGDLNYVKAYVDDIDIGTLKTVTVNVEKLSHEVSKKSCEKYKTQQTKSKRK